MSKNTNSTLFFYQGDKVVNMKIGAKNHTLIRKEDQPLAEYVQETGHDRAKLLACDAHGSVLEVTSQNTTSARAYTAYGHDSARSASEGSHTLLGFNGENRTTPELYVLGNGYRGYSPTSMRFLSPDSLSPFLEGGLNAYSYCIGDPINHVDPSGHMRVPRLFAALFSRKGKQPSPVKTPKSPANDLKAYAPLVKDKVAARKKTANSTGTPQVSPSNPVDKPDLKYAPSAPSRRDLEPFYDASAPSIGAGYTSDEVKYFKRLNEMNFGNSKMLSRSRDPKIRSFLRDTISSYATETERMLGASDYKPDPINVQKILRSS